MRSAGYDELCKACENRPTQLEQKTLTQDGRRGAKSLSCLEQTKLQFVIEAMAVGMFHKVLGNIKPAKESFLGS